MTFGFSLRNRHVIIPVQYIIESLNVTGFFMSSQCSAGGPCKFRGITEGDVL